VASIDAVGPQRAGELRPRLEPRGFLQKGNTPATSELPGSDLSIPSARPIAPAASMDAPFSLVRALHPLCLLWPSRIDHLGGDSRKRRKGFNPRSEPCVASIDAVGAAARGRARARARAPLLPAERQYARPVGAIVDRIFLPSARSITPAASMDALLSLVRALHPLCLLWLSRIDDSGRDSHKRRKGH